MQQMPLIKGLRCYIRAAKQALQNLHAAYFFCHFGNMTTLHLPAPRLKKWTVQISLMPNFRSHLYRHKSFFPPPFMNNHRLIIPIPTISFSFPCCPPKGRIVHVSAQWPATPSPLILSVAPSSTKKTLFPAACQLLQLALNCYARTLLLRPFY